MEQSASDTGSVSSQSLLCPATGRKLLLCVILGMVLIQVGFLIWTRNGLSHFDGYDEADAVRSGEAYAKEGLTSHNGLPRILYGGRFKEVGAYSDHLAPDGKVKAHHRIGFPASSEDPNSWVYTHYPPGPNLMCGVLAQVFGVNQLWMWRLFPITLGLCCFLLFARALCRSLGVDRGIVVAVACAVAPMTNCYLPGLHFEGYTLSFLFLQLALLLRIFWNREATNIWHFAALFLVGFVQGWLSFDHFFIVSFAAIPLWLTRRALGVSPSVRDLMLTVGLPFVAFGFAHFLHLLQIIAELGSLRAAIGELTHTAVDRAGLAPDAHSFSFLQSSFKMMRLYGRDFLKLYNPHFGPFLVLGGTVAALLIFFRKLDVVMFRDRANRPSILRLAWPGKTSLAFILFAAFVVSGIWSVVMPAATVGNFHIWPRTFFFFYFMVWISVVQGLSFERKQV